MKLSEAQSIVKGEKRRTGYAVTFEVRGRGLLRSDHFPDLHGGEPGIPTEDEAWTMAAAFAHAKQGDEVVNVYVIEAHGFAPVRSYRSRMLNVYPQTKDEVRSTG